VAALEQPAAIDPEKLMGFVFRAVAEVGATLNTALVVMGDRFGLYRALAAAGWPEVRPDTARGPIGGHRNVPAPPAGPPPGMRINGGAVDAVVSRRGRATCQRCPPCRRIWARGCCGGRADPGDTGLSAEGGEGE
jgi:hypothetical protein